VDTRVDDGGQYIYIVYADNGLYCTPAVSGAIESKRPPGQASGSATVVPNGTTGQFDIRAGNDLRASGRHAKFQYQLGDGVWRDVVEGQWLTSFADQSVYGNPQTVTFRACRDADSDLYCGESSGAQTLTPVNARAAIQSCVVGSVPTSALPVNAGMPTVRLFYSYSRGNLLGTYPDDSFSPYSESAVAPEPALFSDHTEVRVKAEVQFGAGPALRDPGFDQEACTS
jgi:hypothetical protein